MKYFSIRELTYSTTAHNKGIRNWPDGQVERNLTALVENVLDPLREAYGKPIYVNSGYRCPDLNRAVGGVSTSDHLCQGTAAAADITTRTKKGNLELFRLAQELNLPFKQLIDEKQFAWVHISYDPRNIKRQVLRL